MSAIIEFLKGTGKDNNGRSLEEILNWSDARLESSHDTIQWLFPNIDPSRFNPDAPKLTTAEIEAMKTPEVQQGVLKTYDRFTEFYNKPHWLRPNNHNYRRLTRILKCLGLAGLEKEKSVLKKVLNALYIRFGKDIGAETKRFWDEA